MGFSSRLLDPEAKDRKYVNSPDSPLFHKKEQLYGLHAALDAIRRERRAVVVEGNFDVLALHEAGIDEAVAPMGTALTAEQVGHAGPYWPIASWWCSTATRPAQRAAHKAVPLFVEADVDGRIARLPDGHGSRRLRASRRAPTRSASWSKAQDRWSSSSSMTWPGPRKPLFPTG